MFSLIMGFWRLLFKKSEFQVLIVGLDGAGKTVREARAPPAAVARDSPVDSCARALVPQSVLEQIKGIFSGMEPLPPNKIPPTVGLNIGRMRIERTNLVFWDLGGQRSLRSLWEKYYSEAHALLFVVDASDGARLDESRETLQQLLNNPELAGIPTLVLANKQDAPGAVSAHEVQSRIGLEAEGGGGGPPQIVLGVTALTGDGVEQGVRWLVDSIHASPRGERAMLGGDGVFPT